MFFSVLFYSCLFQIVSVSSYSPFFNDWHCIGIKDKIDFTKPYRAAVGDLPLVVWQNANGLLATLNICKHMGSRLDVGTITDQGCLKCPYHGLEFSKEDAFGTAVEHEGKIFWAYKPEKKTPYPIPFFNRPEYETSVLEIDMDCSLTDSAYNTMDLRHPEFVHRRGFGNTVPPTNVKHYTYPSDPKRVGLAFDYESNKIMRTINDNTRKTSNFHMYIYPTFSWSKVSFENKDLVIGVHLLPIGPKKTRWYITLCHNYYTSEIGKAFMRTLALTILGQDYSQMKHQAEESALKRAVLFDHIFKDEEPILFLKSLFSEYKYPDMEQCAELYKDFQRK
jgi:nitrite reductase/ring-hydroxylating ferredoxin subunit